MNNKADPRINRTALGIVAFIVALLAILSLPFAENQNERSTNKPIKQDSESEIQTPAGSRVVTIEINIDDTSHGIIYSGDRMDVIELNAVAENRGHRTIAANAIVSKTEYDRRHPLIHVILNNELADVVEPKVPDGNIGLAHATLGEN